MWSGWWSSWNWWVLGVFWLVVIALFLKFLPRYWRGRQARPRAERILLESFSRGEITREEFERKMRELHRAA